MTDKFLKCEAEVLKHEGTLSLDPNDNGNWTGGEKGVGQLKGTKYGISAAAYPNLDIPNLTLEQAQEIYYQDYWLKANCERLDLPLALMHFDYAVNGGVQSANMLLAKYPDLVLYCAARLYNYTSFSTWEQHGKGWTKRIMQVLAKARSWQKEMQPKIELYPEVQGNDVLIRVQGEGLKAHIRRDQPNA